MAESLNSSGAGPPSANGEQHTHANGEELPNPNADGSHDTANSNADRTPNPKVKELRNPNAKDIYSKHPLSSRFKWTRCFKIQDGAWDEQMRCTLKTVKLSLRPVYHAISYAWGETAGEDGPPKEETILLDEKEFKISTNLASALRHFRSSYPDQLLWADAISHNQDDDDEMNAQVDMMREIYKECEEVHVWLGKSHL
jgi:hypothetical protein